MLDTNILIFLIKRKPPSVIERFGQCAPDDELMMSFVTYAELLKGSLTTALSGTPPNIDAEPMSA